MPAVIITNDEFRKGGVDIDQLLADIKAVPATTEGELTILDFHGLKLVARYNIEHFHDSQEDTTAVIALQGRLGFLEHAIATLHLAGHAGADKMEGDGSATILERFDIAVHVEFLHTGKQLILEPRIKVGTKMKSGRVELKI